MNERLIAHVGLIEKPKVKAKFLCAAFFMRPHWRLAGELLFLGIFYSGAYRVRSGPGVAVQGRH